MWPHSARPKQRNNRPIAASIGLVAETVNPSFLAVHSNGKFLYAANEVDNFQGQPTGSISAFAIDPATHHLKLLNQVSAKGSGPCHVALDHTGKWLFTANYGSGSVAAFPVHDDGSLGEASSFVQHTGSSAERTSSLVITSAVSVLMRAA